MKLFMGVGALTALIGVMLGAFGAHALKSRLTPEMLSIFEVGVRYQMYHSFALLVAGLCVERFSSSLLGASGWCFIFGILVFSGTLYLYVMTGSKWIARLTPLGGLGFMAGWLFLFVAIVREVKGNQQNPTS